MKHVPLWTHGNRREAGVWCRHSTVKNDLQNKAAGGAKEEHLFDVQSQAKVKLAILMTITSSEESASVLQAGQA